MMSILGAGFSPAMSGDLSHPAEARNQADPVRCPTRSAVSAAHGTWCWAAAVQGNCRRHPGIAGRRFGLVWR
jgi:hypothetical protein